MCRLSWFLDPGGWSKTATVGLYFIFPGICTLSLVSVYYTTLLKAMVLCTDHYYIALCDDVQGEMKNAVLRSSCQTALGDVILLELGLAPSSSSLHPAPFLMDEGFMMIGHS
ncbi:hypothetical protein STEG23_013002, partial [Scotinomys teguina]